VYLSPDDARSDVILAGAATVFGGVLISYLLSAPGVPTSGLGAELIVLVAWVTLTGLVPFLLARYRQDVPGAFALPGGLRPITTALVLTVPVVLLGIGRGLLVDGSTLVAGLGRVGRALSSSPVVGPSGGDPVGVVLAVAQVVILTAGSLLLVAFLTVRGRDAFRSDERSATEVLRTFGVGAVGVSLVGGVIAAGSGITTFGAVGLNVLAAAALVLIADRTVPVRATVSRPAVLTPLVLVSIAHVLAAGGIIRGLVGGLYSGGLAAATVVVIAVVIEQRRAAGAVLPLLFVVHWWPTCLSPVTFGAAGC
jgi:hypothetical protein